MAFVWHFSQNKHFLTWKREKELSKFWINYKSFRGEKPKKNSLVRLKKVKNENIQFNETELMLEH